MSSDKRNLITTKAPGLIFSLFDIYSLTGAFWHTAVHTVHQLWTYRCHALCSIHFVDSPRSRFEVAQWFSYICKWESSVFLW